jgi:hypothetical protein
MLTRQMTNVLEESHPHLGFMFAHPGHVTLKIPQLLAQLFVRHFRLQNTWEPSYSRPLWKRILTRPEKRKRPEAFRPRPGKVVVSKARKHIVLVRPSSVLALPIQH